MNSIGHNCNELKHKYDECFQSWFTDQFLKGNVTKDACDPLFKLYQQCIQLLKDEYDACFNMWFSQKFLKGEHNDVMCAGLLKVYKECVEKTMKEHHIELKDAEINYLGTDKECKPPLRDKSSK